MLLKPPPEFTDDVVGGALALRASWAELTLPVSNPSIAPINAAAPTSDDPISPAAAFDGRSERFATQFWMQRG